MRERSIATKSAVRKRQICPICGITFRPTRCRQRTCGVACSVVLRRGQGNLGRPFAVAVPCALDGCERRAEKRGLCQYHYAKRPDQLRAKRSAHLKRNYGITIDEFEVLLEAQGGVCAVCATGNSGKRWHVDHCHASGAIRGILCAACNTWLGRYERPGFVARVDAYLNRA